MRYTEVGRSRLRFSAIAFGAWQLGDASYWGESDPAEGVRAVHAALDQGITLFDTAEMYGGGESERALGKALEGRRDKAVVATKALPEHCAPEQLRAACEQSLRRLGTEYIDLYQVHWPNHEAPFEETYGALARLQEEGKIREIGVSNFGQRDLDAWCGAGSAVSNQVGYNLLFRAPEYAMIPACVRKKVHALAYMPLMQGLLAGRWQKVDEIPESRRRTRHFSSNRTGTRHGENGCEEMLAVVLAKLRDYAAQRDQPLSALSLAWLLAQPGVTSVVAGARNARHVQGNVEAAALDLGPDGVGRLNALSWPVKRLLGRNPDMWQSGANVRIR